MTSTQSDAETTNAVRLVGRLSSPVEQRVLPSGDELSTFRVAVPRARRGRTRRERSPSVDAIDIACFTAATRRRAARLEMGERIEVHGALRRRFFRTPGGVQSRYDVEASALRRPPAE